MLTWMSHNTLPDRIKRWNILDMLEITPIEDKMEDSFKIVWSCTKETHRCHSAEKLAEVIGTSRERGRLKKTWVETVANDPKPLH